MPTQQRPWSDQTYAARAEWQVTGCRCEQGPISRPKLRPRDLPAQNLELVPQHQQLDVLQVQAAATTERARQEEP